MFEKLRLRLFEFVHSTYFPYIFLIILPLIIFRPVVFGNNVFALGDFSGSDLLELHLPFKYILHDAYTHGKFPLWSPYLSNGFPVLAEGQSGPLYPPTIILAFLPPVLSLNYSILLAFMIGGCGTYIFARRLPGMGKAGALGCAIAFVFGSFFVGRLKHLNMITVAAFLPWSLWCIQRYFDDRKLRWYVWLGIVWAMQLLAGHPHMFYLCAFMCGWYVLGELVYQSFVSRSNSGRDYMTVLFLKTILGLFISGILALGLSAAQLLPTYELTKLSTRQDFSYDVSTAYPLRPQFLASLFAPFFLGNPATGSYRGNIQTDGIWWENILYIGLLPFALVVVLFVYRLQSLLWRGSFFSRKKRVIHLETFRLLYYYWYFVVTAVLFFVLSMGSYSFLFSVVYYNLPGMSLFRFPTRFNLMTLLALSVMAGWGIERVMARLEHSRVQGNIKKEDSSDYVFSWPFTRFITAIILLGVIFLDLSVFADQYIAYYPVSKYLSIPDSVLTFREKDPYLYRIYPMTQYSQNPFGVMGWKKGEKAIYSLQKAIPGNFAAIYHMYSFTDRGWFEGGLGVKERFLLENFITKNELPGAYISRLLGLWNVKYILSFNDLPEPSFNPYESYTLDSSFGLPLQIHRNTSVQPRAFFVESLIKMNDPSEVLQHLIDLRNPAEKYAYAEGTGKSLPQEASSAAVFHSDEFVAAHSVSIVSYESNLVSMKTKTTSEAYLLFSDTYYPGWKVYIDGKENPLIKANLAMRAVKVPAGEHTVLWSFEPIAFYVGCGISFATLITLGSYFFLEKRKGRLNRGKLIL